MKPISLSDWSVTRIGGLFQAPELWRECLQGRTSEHPKKMGQMKQVTTSPIVGINGRLITTESGSVYLLGEPAPRYVEWLAEHGDSIDPDQPIRDKRKP